MKVLELNRHLFILLWILPTPTNKTLWFKRRNIIFGISNFLAVVLGLITSTCFIFKYASVNLEESLYALLQLAAFASQIYLLIVGCIQWSKFAEMFPKLQKIYDENQHLDKSKFMEKADKTAKFITTWVTQYLVIGWFSSGAVFAVFSVLYSIMRTHSIQVDQWYDPLRLVLPWNRNTVAGWIGETLFSNVISAAYIIVNYMFLSFFIGLCLHHRAYFNHIQSLIAVLTHNCDPLQSKLQLREVIRFHNSAKEIFLQSADLYSSCVLMILLSSMTTLACSIFQLDLVTRHLDFSMALLLTAVTTNSSTLFLYCFFGQSATDAYLDISNCYFNANWLKLSPEQQKYFIVMIANAQRPLYYHGFGLANLELKTFLRMIKTVISFYMMFKTLTK